MAALAKNFSWERTSREPADVCLIVEGCYPFVPGGVSGWIDWLIRTQPELKFSVVSLWPSPKGTSPRYEMPDNAISFQTIFLQDFGKPPRRRETIPGGIDAFSRALDQFMRRGGVDGLATVMRTRAQMTPKLEFGRLLNGPAAWDIVHGMYETRMPHGSFLHYFWAWRALLGGLFATLEAPLPAARVYHTISTGYAGVLAARAARETGRPMLLTEHGIYTNERRIELLMADWVVDTLDKGHNLEDDRTDLRDLWIEAFEAYARTCYEGANEVITLYEDNQRVQNGLGAASERCRVIANGIAVERFAGLGRAADDARPTMALIGRVVPIKDVKTYIRAAHSLRRRIPNLRAYILGPLDEDQIYVAECQELVASLGLEGCIEFTGQVDITKYLPDVHVVALTSLSESQPLTLLEAGAAGVPFVSSNVGSCREIIEGRSDELPALGQGGFITPVVAPEATADAVEKLLRDPALRRRLGDTLRARVNQFYRSEQAASAYRQLYAHYRALD